MIKKALQFILHSRLENVMAVFVSACLLTLFLTTRLFHDFDLGALDFVFILLPVGLLSIKVLFELLAGKNQAGEDANTLKYIASFFGPLVKILRDWFPFFLLCACYYALYTNLMLRINPHTADATLSRIDAAIFGNQVSFMLEPFIRPWLTDFLNAVYFSHVLVFPSVALYFYLAGETKAFRRLMMGYLTLFLMGILSYLVVPAVGPEKFFADKYTHDLQGQILSRGVDYIINVGRVGYDCFPSLHVGIPLLVSMYIYNYRRKFFIPAIIYVLLMCLATLYLRYHYATDLIGSFIYAPTAYFLNDFFLRHWPGERAQAEAEEKNHPQQVEKGKALTG